MHILVTNDDGVKAPGLLALAQAMKPFGKVSVVAPDHNWSAAGHSKTLHRPIRVQKVRLIDGTEALATSGAPSDCVAMSLLGMLEPVDLVVSGINPYANLGSDVTYSGTVTAAMEAVIAGKIGLAFSLNGPEKGKVDYTPAGMIAKRVVERVIEKGLPPAVVLSVNIPCLPVDKIKGFSITRRGQRIYHDKLVPHWNLWGRTYYRIGGKPPTGVPEDGTDIGALEQGYVSITPLELDMTAYHFMDELKGWRWD